MLAAKEDFDAQDQATRTIEWVGYLQKDRAEGEYERGRDARRMAEAMVRDYQLCKVPLTVQCYR